MQGGHAADGGEEGVGGADGQEQAGSHKEED